MSHPLDRHITLSGKVHELRFSIGAFAKLSSELEADSPAKLAEALCVTDPKRQKDIALILLNTMSVCGAVSDVSDNDLKRLMPLIADMIVEAFDV